MNGPPTPSCRLVDATALPVYDLGVEHPFARDRQGPLFDLIRRHELVSTRELFLPDAAPDELLRLAHDQAYIDVVRRLSEAPPAADQIRAAMRFGLGTSDNPIAPGQHDAARAVAGATAACAELVMRGKARHAFNSTGGLHHAMPAAASGFCIYNDLVVGIRRARELGAERVLYVDFDVHHGDGVEHAFRADKSVMTISFHESPDVRWPGTGRITEMGDGDARGFAINMPFASQTQDESWLNAVRRVTIPAARRFRPDLIVTQHGCDPHRDDPLADLHLTTAPMIEAARIAKELADDLCGGRWVATGGGGYQPVRVIPRTWAGVWCVMSGRELPERVDDGWLAAWQESGQPPLPTHFLDQPATTSTAERAAATNESTATRLLDLLEACSSD